MQPYSQLCPASPAGKGASTVVSSSCSSRRASSLPLLCCWDMSSLGPIWLSAWPKTFNLANVYISTGLKMSGKHNQTLRSWIPKPRCWNPLCYTTPIVGASVDEGIILITKLLHAMKKGKNGLKWENIAKIPSDCQKQCIKAAIFMSCWNQAAYAPHWRVNCRLSCLLMSRWRKLAWARLHLLSFALV